MIKAIIWDYDGTLVDTHVKNLHVTRKIIKQITGKEPENISALANVNNYRIVTNKAENWRTLYRDVFNLNESEIEKAGRLWSEFQLKDETEVPFYSGIVDAIRSFGKYPNGIVSQNSKKNIKQYLHKTGMLKYFKSILGYEEVETKKQKPVPDGLLRCISELVQQKTGSVIYIGDHETDIHCAINANEILGRDESNLKVISIAALYDTDTDFSTWKIKPDYQAEKVEDIVGIMRSIS